MSEGSKKCLNAMIFECEYLENDALKNDWNHVGNRNRQACSVIGLSGYTERILSIHRMQNASLKHLILRHFHRNVEN